MMERVKFDKKIGVGYTKYKVKELKNVYTRLRTLEEKTRKWKVKVKASGLEAVKNICAPLKVQRKPGGELE